jgi:MFS family permease
VHERAGLAQHPARSVPARRELARTDVVLARALGLGLGLATLAVGAAALGNVAARVAAGAASDRLGIEPVLAAILAVNLVAAGIFFGAPGVPIGFLAASLAAGAGFGGAAGIMSRAGARAAPDAPNSAFGIHFAGYCLGAFAGPLAGTAAGGRLAWLVVGAPSLFGVGVLALRSRQAGPGRG